MKKIKLVDYKITSRESLLVMLAIIFTILVPSIRLGNMPSFRLEQLVVFSYFPYVLWKFKTKGEIQVHRLLIFKLLLGFSFFIIISIINSYIQGYKVVVNDFFELYKVFVYCGILLMVSSTLQTYEEKLEALKLVNICILITCFVSFTQYFNFFNINELYIYQLAPSQYKTLVGDYPFPRVVGLTHNPNIYSYMTSIGCLLSIALYVIEKRKFYISSLLIHFITLLMTRSRTGMIFFIIALTVFVLLCINDSPAVKNQPRKKKLMILFFCILSILAFFLLLLFILPDSITLRFKELLDISKAPSWQARLRHWQEHWGYFTEHFIIGIGPLKSVKYAHYADNEWLIFLKRYGIVGTLYFITIFILPLIKLWNKISKSTLGKIYISIFLASAFYMITTELYHTFQLGALFVIILSIIFSPGDLAKEIELKIKTKKRNKNKKRKKKRKK